MKNGKKNSSAFWLFFVGFYLPESEKNTPSHSIGRLVFYLPLIQVLKQKKL